MSKYSTAKSCPLGKVQECFREPMNAESGEIIRLEIPVLYMGSRGACRWLVSYSKRQREENWP